MITPEFAKKCHYDSDEFYKRREIQTIRNWLEKLIIQNYDIGKIPYTSLREENIQIVLDEFTERGWTFMLDSKRRIINFSSNNSSLQKNYTGKITNLWKRIWKM